MTILDVARGVALIVALTAVAPALAQPSEPGPPLQFGRKFFTTIVTAVLSTDETHAGTWLLYRLERE